jgi:hypothetical protein
VAVVNAKLQFEWSEEAAATILFEHRVPFLTLVPIFDDEFFERSAALVDDFR